MKELLLSNIIYCSINQHRSESANWPAVFLSYFSLLSLVCFEMQNKTNKYKQQNGKKDKGKSNTINYYVHKHLLSGLHWLFLNNFPDFFQSHTFCCILNSLSSPLQPNAIFISGFYIFFLGSAFMSADTFSSTESHTKNHKRRKLQNWQ